MPHIATKINCDGDKCGECKFMFKGVVFDDLGISHFCTHHNKGIKNGVRVPECLAGELVRGCKTCNVGMNHCRLRYREKFITCNVDNNYQHWQPATDVE